MQQDELKTLSPRAVWRFSGRVGRLLDAVTRQWLLPLPDANPALLAMYFDRNQEPYRNLLPWSGEFAGKYLTGAAEIYALTGDERLRAHLSCFVRELARAQAEDGYLGPWPDGYRLTGRAPNCHLYFDDDPRHVEAPDAVWDAWDEYHMMLGLLTWYETGGDAGALACARRIGDLLCDLFGDAGARLCDLGCQEMNMAPIHALCLLYEKAGDPRHLRLAQKIAGEFSDPSAGNYLEAALAGRAFYQMPKPRWESLHCVQGLAALGRLTGEARCLQAFERIWRSIRSTDRHNTGGFSTGEGAIGDPYAPGPIETCCTVAWMALTADLLRLRRDSEAADELELSFFNAGLGAFSPTGRWWVYDTPMDGMRKAFCQDHNWQARPGAPELSCCAANGPRLMGLLRAWAVLEGADGPVINYYGPLELETQTPGERRLWIAQKTDYPASGEVVLRIAVEQPERFTLRLRIPAWSRRTALSIDGAPQSAPVCGAYHAIERMWHGETTLSLSLDFRTRVVPGEGACAGKVSLYRGPVLAAFDEGVHPALSAGAPPVVHPQTSALELEADDGVAGLGLTFGCEAADGRRVRLVDFAGAGALGRRYASWLPIL